MRVQDWRCSIFNLVQWVYFAVKAKSKNRQPALHAQGTHRRDSPCETTLWGFAAHPDQRHCHITSCSIPRWCISIKTSKIICGKIPSPNFKKLGTFVFHGLWALHPPTTFEIPAGLLRKLNRRSPLPLATDDLYQHILDGWVLAAIRVNHFLLMVAVGCPWL